MKITVYMPEGKPSYIKAECPYCQHEQQIEVLVKDGTLTSPRKAVCGTCGKGLRVVQGTLFKPWRYYLFTAIAYGIVIPAIIVDSFLWKQINRLSVWMQTTFNISKYHLTLAAYILSMSFYLFGLPLTGISILIWTWLGWDAITFCVHQIRTGASEEETEQVSLAEAALMSKWRATRVTCLLMGGMLFIVLALGAQVFDPAAAGLLAWCLMGYFIDSKYVPPSRRKILDLGMKWARVGSS